MVEWKFRAEQIQQSRFGSEGRAAGSLGHGCSRSYRAAGGFIVWVLDRRGEGTVSCARPRARGAEPQGSEAWRVVIVEGHGAEAQAMSNRRRALCEGLGTTAACCRETQKLQP